MSFQYRPISRLYDINSLKIILLFLLSSYIYGDSFSKSKKILLKKIYYDHKITFYCHNPYEIKRIKGKEKAVIIKDNSKYTPRNKLTKKGKVNIRAEKVEWEHIIPAENFGRQFSCWRNGDDRCITKKGKRYKGRRCCKKVSPVFRKMEADMFNLVPSIGEINADRRNYRYMDTIESLKGQYGECQFKVDFKKKKVYPPNYTKGFIARVYLYFSKKYKMKLSKRDRKMFEAWDKLYPPTKWEKIRKKRIELYSTD
ncbi:MAG: deoxyribonuclease [Epsilonproteobacteria bacterium]|nr:deoxyribonuclease [Campylobacterota bacterium]